jgi:methyl-accepting chemotaxis protein
MAQFEMILFHRLADQLEGIAKDIKEHVNTPQELNNEVMKIRSIVSSMETQIQGANETGTNPQNVADEVR